MSSMWPKGWVAGGIALLALVLLVPLPASAQNTTGVVRGQLANFTEGGGPVEQVTITLDTYEQAGEGANFVGSETVTASGNGSFEFTGLDVSPRHVYQISLTYQGAEYAEWFGFDEGTSEKTANLVVYDSTSSSEAITVTRMHAILIVGPEAIQVTELYLFANEGDRTYIGAEEAGSGARRTVEFSVPPQAAGLKLGGNLTDWSIMPTASGFADTAALFPGTKELMFSYILEYDSDTYDLPLTFFYPVASFDLIVGGQYADVQSDMLIPAAPIGSGSEQFSHFIAENLQHGTTLDISLLGLQSSGPSGLPPAAIAAIVLAHVAGLSFLIVRRRRKKAAVAVPSEVDMVGSERKRLVQEMAALDDSYQAGDIPEDEYLLQRAAKKNELTNLMRGRES